jgi:hypothetical protein
MELAKIESLLEVYFEGNTTIKEEAVLRSYFMSDEVAPHLASYQTMFAGFQMAKQEVSHREVVLPKETNSQRNWWFSIAATAVIAIGIAGFVFQDQGISSEEQEALVALKESKDAMLLLSNHFNKGTEDLAFINQINKTKKRILK